MRKNKYKIFGSILMVLGFLCIAFFFVYTMLEKPTYNITFDTNGGSIIASVTAKEGEIIEIPSIPIKEGYDFLRWEYNNAPYSFNTGVKSDMLIKAIWQKKIIEPQKYTITLKIDNISKEVTVEKFSDINLEELGIKEKNGYTIVWYLDGKEFDEEKSLKSNITLEGKYTKTENFTIKFNSNGGTTVKNQIVKTGGKVEEPQNVAKDGYVLDGWYINSEKYDFDTKVNRGFTLVAKWSEDPSVKWYTVSFDTDGGTDIKSERVKENGTVKKPTDPTKKDLVFDKWTYKDKPFEFSSKITSDTELKAIWREKEKYQVIFQYDDGTEYMKREVMEGEKVVRPTDPTKTDNEFLEWRLDDKKFDFDTIIKKNIVLKAKFNPQKTNCIVKFATGDGATTIPPRTIKCGETTPQPSDPVKEGYRLVAWHLNGIDFSFSSKIMSDVTLEAIYEKIN